MMQADPAELSARPTDQRLERVTFTLLNRQPRRFRVVVVFRLWEMHAHSQTRRSTR